MTDSEQKKKKTCFFSVIARETREGWPLLTVETEANGDSWSTNDRDPSFWLVRWAHLCRYNRFLSSLGCSSRPSTKYFLKFIFPYLSATFAVFGHPTFLSQVILFCTVSLVFLPWKCRPLFTSSIHFLFPIYYNSRQNIIILFRLILVVRLG